LGIWPVMQAAEGRILFRQPSWWAWRPVVDLIGIAGLDLSYILLHDLDDNHRK